MKKLSKEWITEGRIDYEYKKYILLAYLQHVSRNFNETRLYPFLSDLIEHYRNLKELKENKTRAKNELPGTISRVDLEHFRLEYEKLYADDEYLEEIEKILDFAIPSIDRSLREGREIYDLVEENMEIEPIGILPINKDFGYMLIKDEGSREVKVYNYEITLFNNPETPYRGIRTRYVNSYEKSISTTFEHIKLKLIREDRSMPNPATFLVQSKMAFPMKETFLPVAKRYFVRYLFSL